MPAKVPSSTSRRIQTRRSGVHGKGVFAVQPIAEGEVLIEYTGEVIGWQEAQDRHPHDPLQPNHTFYFHVDDDRVIDAKFGGNSARWINHSCDPNCEADETDGRADAYYQVFSPALVPEGPARPLLQTHDTASIPSIVPAGTGFAIGWNEYALEGSAAGHGEIRTSKVMMARVR